MANISCKLGAHYWYQYRAFKSTRAMTTYLWLDCDPGHDDAMAIILAAHGMNPNVIVAGVSTTCGNQTLAKTTDNALRILHLIGRDDVGARPPPPREHHRTIVRAHRVVLSIPNRHSSHLSDPSPAVARVAEVYAGADKPLTRPRRNCPEIHGESGLDGPDIPPAPRGANPKKAIVAMAAAFERILEIPSARPVLVATGALTNVALLFSVYPELAGAVEVVLMGGALGKGNTGPVAEFNIQCDPEAARIVFESGANLTMVPLEATHTALVTPEVRERLLGNPAASGRAPSRFRRLVDELMRFFADTYKEVFDFEDPPLHDPCAVAYAVAPEMFETKDLRVDVECGSELCAGQTVVDWWRQSPEKPINCRVCVKMDVDKFWDAMCEAVDNANVACPLRE